MRLNIIVKFGIVLILIALCSCAEKNTSTSKNEADKAIIDDKQAKIVLLKPGYWAGTILDANVSVIIDEDNIAYGFGRYKDRRWFSLQGTIGEFSRFEGELEFYNHSNLEDRNIDNTFDYFPAGIYDQTKNVKIIFEKNYTGELKFPADNEPHTWIYQNNFPQENVISLEGKWWGRNIRVVGYNLLGDEFRVNYDVEIIISSDGVVSGRERDMSQWGGWVPPTGEIVRDINGSVNEYAIKGRNIFGIDVEFISKTNLSENKNYKGYGYLWNDGSRDKIFFNSVDAEGGDPFVIQLMRLPSN